MKANEISCIFKSTKTAGYAWIKLTSGKTMTRKAYEWKTGELAGKHTVNIEADIFSFVWANEQAIDIKWHSNYSKTGLLSNIKEEMEAKNIQVPEVKHSPVIITQEDGKVRHEEYETIKTCIELDIPIYLVGPAGSGKNHTLEQIAEDLGLDFHFTNSVQQEFKLTGFIDAGGKYHETEFYRAFTEGGLFFLDELDASIPEVLVLLNAAIANKIFEFPNGLVEAHEDFRVVAAGNTMGNGADEQYVGRLTLDQATLDRFTLIPFDYSYKIELHLAKGNIEMVNFIRDLRKQATDKGVRATFSYRCITMMQKLEGKLELTKIMQIVVFKGMDKDTLNTFHSNGYTKYDSAMKAIQ